MHCAVLRFERFKSIGSQNAGEYTPSECITSVFPILELLDCARGSGVRLRPTRHHTASHAKSPTVTVGVLIIKMVRANYGTSQEPAEKREDKKMRVGFIGLGKMGSAMARNLIKAGHELVLYNRTRSRAEELQPLGARVAGTPGEAASGVEGLITMLADDRAVEDAMLGHGQALQSLPAGAVHAGMSTISVALSRRLAAAHRERQQHYVAAPVFGRPEAAAAGRLFIVAAGPTKQVERCQVLFDAMGQKTFVLDEEPSSANVTKLAGNFLISTTIESLAEAFSLVRKSGVDPNKFLEVLTGSLFSAPVVINYGGMIAANHFEPVGFKLPLGFKDNRLVLAAAEEAAVPMPMARLVHDRLVGAIAQGLTEADWTAIARISFQRAGLEKAA